MESHLLKNQAAVYLNIFLHAGNSLACLIDIFASARPWKAFHFLYAVIFGFVYAAFSLIYWGAGGVGICYPSRTETATVHKGDSFIHSFIRSFVHSFIHSFIFHTFIQLFYSILGPLSNKHRQMISKNPMFNGLSIPNQNQKNIKSLFPTL